MKLFLAILFLATAVQAQTFTETKEFDQIEAVRSGHCQIRQATRVFKGDVEIAKSYHRWAIEPGGDLSQFDARVKAICKAAWPPDVIKKYREQLKKNADPGKK